LLATKIIQVTEDGSHTISIPELHVAYHSKHGAIQESMHVFINEGLQYLFDKSFSSPNKSIHIFEVGFGTGLNALLSLQFAIQQNQKILYQTIEAFPLSIEESNHLNYVSLIDENLQGYFKLMHACEWNKEIVAHPLFSFKKINRDLQQFETQEKFHLIYFDAFDPTVQPELWTENIFKKMYEMLHANGILVTYCSKGMVRRAMQAAGFSIEKLKGPKGKREIVRAVKT
jgi:tRNA U34 5-methylaminomethyl-2-thiouridine-forming methyltransferase MnmC